MIKESTEGLVMEKKQHRQSLQISLKVKNIGNNLKQRIGFDVLGVT